MSDGWKQRALEAESEAAQLRVALDKFTTTLSGLRRNMTFPGREEWDLLEEAHNRACAALSSTAGAALLEDIARAREELEGIDPNNPLSLRDRFRHEQLVAALARWIPEKMR